MENNSLDPAAVERERIVRWLRMFAPPQMSDTSSRIITIVADMIERLDHLKDRPDDR